MGCTASVVRDGRKNEMQAPTDAKLVALQGNGDGPVLSESSGKELDRAMTALRARAAGAFALVAEKLREERSLLYMLNSDLVEELLSVWADKNEREYHCDAGMLLGFLHQWCREKISSHSSVPKGQVYESAVRCLVGLAEHKKRSPNSEICGGRSPLRRTGSAGLTRTSSFEVNENGLYPEIVVDLAKPFRIRQVNEGWQEAFGHKKEVAIGRTVNLIFGPNTDTVKFEGFLKTTSIDGSARGLITVYNAEGEALMVTLSCTGIFGTGGCNADDGIFSPDEYKSCMLIFRPADARIEGKEANLIGDAGEGNCRALVAMKNSKVHSTCARFSSIFGMEHKNIKGRNFAMILGPEPDMLSWQKLLDAAKIGMAKGLIFRTYNMQGHMMRTNIHSLPICTMDGSVTHLMLTLTTLENDCPSTCPCYSDFRQAEDVDALLSVMLDERASSQGRRIAIGVLQCIASNSAGIEMLQKQDAFPALALLALSGTKGHATLRDARIMALDLLKEVAAERPAAIAAGDVVGPILSIACDSEHDGNRLQLTALEIIQTLALDGVCVERMLASDLDVIVMLTVVQQRMIQAVNIRHAFAAGQALAMIRKVRTGRRLDTNQQTHKLMTVLQEESVWGVDTAMRAEALNDFVSTVSRSSRRSRRSDGSRSRCGSSGASSREQSLSRSRSRDSSVESQDRISFQRQLPVSSQQESLAPIARGRTTTLKDISDSKFSSVNFALLGSAGGSSNRLNSPESMTEATNAGWKPADSRLLPSRESAEETRERRAARRKKQREANIGLLLGKEAVQFRKKTAPDDDIAQLLPPGPSSPDAGRTQRRNSREQSEGL